MDAIKLKMSARKMGCFRMNFQNLLPPKSESLLSINASLNVSKPVKKAQRPHPNIEYSSNKI